MCFDGQVVAEVGALGCAISVFDRNQVSCLHVCVCNVCMCASTGCNASVLEAVALIPCARSDVSGVLVSISVQSEGASCGLG